MIKDYVDKHTINKVLLGLEKMQGRKTLFIDMDGVIADFDASAEEWGKKEGITAQEFMDRNLYRQEGFYLGLRLIEGAKEAIEKLDEKYYVVFVSAPSWQCIESFTEKRIWIEREFGDKFEKRMDLSFHKGHYMGHYLIDDRVKYGAGDFIGEHLMYGNDEYPDWDSILNKLL